MEMPEGWVRITRKYLQQEDADFLKLKVVDSDVVDALTLMREMAEAIEYDFNAEDSVAGYKRLETVLQKFKEWK